jgi:hypothetical protein
MSKGARDNQTDKFSPDHAASQAEKLWSLARRYLLRRTEFELRTDSDFEVSKFDWTLLSNTSW